MTDDQPSEVLAHRLRRLREQGFGRRLTQKQLCVAFDVKDATISSWETGTVTPDDARLEVYARLFATRRSVTDGGVTLVALDELTADERARHDELLQDLRRLRGRLAPGAVDAVRPAPALPASSTWTFPDPHGVLIIPSKLPEKIIGGVEYADPWHENYIRMLWVADGDAVVALYGGILARNPTKHVDFKLSDQVDDADDLEQHLVLLGGDWNDIARDFVDQIGLPVFVPETEDSPAETSSSEASDSETPDPHRSDVAPFFRNTLNGLTAKPRFVEGFVAGERRTRLVEDVALFARSPNPANPQTTLTICQGIYSRGTLGAARLFTAANHAQANEEHLAKISLTFGREQLDWLLVRVRITRDHTMTPPLADSLIAYGTASDYHQVEGAGAE